MKTDWQVYRNKHLISAVIWIGIFAVLAIRSRHAVFLPILGHEDGRDMLAFFFNNNAPSAILRFHNGYISLVPNAIAWAATCMPLPVIPYVFTLSSLVIATTGFYLVSHTGHAWLVPEAGSRTIIAFMLALLPLGRGYLVTNLTYSQWSLLFLLFVLLTRRPLPSGTAGMSIYALMVSLCAASHPLAILALPLCIVQSAVHRQRSGRLCLLFCACVIVGYQIFGVSHTSSVTPSIQSVIWALKVFLARVPFESLFGARASTQLAAGGTSYLFAYSLMILCILAGMALSGPRPIWNASIAMGAILLAFAIVWVSASFRYAGPETRIVYLEKPFLQRYIYVPKLIFVLVFLQQLVPRIRSAMRRNTIFVKAAVIAACCLFVYGVNWHNHFLYREPETKTEAYRVRHFLAAVYADIHKAKRGEVYQSKHVLERGGGRWDIVLMLDHPAENPDTAGEVVEGDK